MSEPLVSIRKWGPATWQMLHTISFMVPHKQPQRQQQYVEFFNSVANVLPCPSCREHLKQHLKEEPPQCSSARECAEWVFRLHNKVNQNTGKPAMEDFLQVVAMYLPPSMFHLIDPTPEELAKLNEWKKKLDSAENPKKQKKTTQNQPKTWVVVLVVLLFLLIIAALVYATVKRPKAK